LRSVTIEKGRETVNAYPLQAGRAQVVITPPLGVSMAGYYHDRRADDVLDDLHAKALVLSDQATSAALVVCDLIGLKREMTSRIRTQVAQRTGIPDANVLICCTHTHTGPITSSWAEADIHPDQAYLDVLARHVADAVQLAYQHRHPAALYVGRGHVEGIGSNRRLWMRDGTLRTNPPFQSPEIVRPAGPIDPELGIWMVRDADDVPLAMVNTYALHPDQVGGTALCADYGGAEARLLQQLLGPQCTILCPNGTCGDINHFDFDKPAAYNRGPHVHMRSGHALAGEAIVQLPNLQLAGAGPVRAGSRTIEAVLRVPTEEEVAWAKEAVAGEMHGFDAGGLAVVKAHRILRLHHSGQAAIPVEISALVVGDSALVGLPGEIFVELGLEIKARSPFGYTTVAELCNDAIGYVPTRKAYDEGGYESTSSPLAPGTGEQMVEAALALLSDLSTSG
jgi:hypothetical protein